MASDTAQRLQAEHEVGATWVAEEERLAVLQRSQLLDLPCEPEFDRWTVALRRETGAALAALILVDATRMVVKSLSIAGGSVQEASELPLSTPLAEYLIGRTDLPACPAAPAYAEAQVVVNGQLLGWMVVADHPVREWSESHLKALEDAATGVSTEVSVRLAHQAATRMQELVASHNRLHELIAQAATLSDVLCELVTGIERYEPSVIPGVVLLDRDTNTLHPGAGGHCLPTISLRSTAWSSGPTSAPVDPPHGQAA
jgi:hypothetical protein